MVSLLIECFPLLALLGQEEIILKTSYALLYYICFAMMCAYACVCTCICVHTRASMCMYECMHECAYVFIYTCVYILVILYSCRIAANFDGTGSVALTKRDYFTINIIQIWSVMLYNNTHINQHTQL